jgi:putative peptidoglycan lipid II flippase
VASSLPEGSISHLAYAFKVVALISTLLATGMTTVIFPSMARLVAVGNLYELKRTLSVGLRLMWAVTAPVTALCMVLALPFVTALFQRGAFTPRDAQAVAGLLQWYALALGAMTLGGITGRIFYVLKDTRTVAVMGVLEMLAYVFYTPWLAGQLGARGVALAYCIYFITSLLWHFPVIWYKLGRRGGLGIARSFIRIGLAASVGGTVAWGTARLLPSVWLHLSLGGALGLAAYTAVLLGLGSAEVRMIWRAILAAANKFVDKPVAIPFQTKED